MTKNEHFWTTYLPRLVNVVCERPLSNIKHRNQIIADLSTGRFDRIRLNVFSETNKFIQHINWNVRPKIKEEKFSIEKSIFVFACLASHFFSHKRLNLISRARKSKKL